MLHKLKAAHAAGKLAFFGAHAALANAKTFAALLAPLRKTRWFVYSKRPFGGPKAVLAYLARYAHRVAISNRRLLGVGDRGVTFKVKDYRVEGPGRYTTMTLATHEFIRRFLMHVLPKELHRLRHYGLLASGTRAASLAMMRELLGMAAPRAGGRPRRRGNNARSTHAAMPVLRRTDARHRDLPGRAMPQARASPSADVIRIDTS